MKKFGVYVRRVGIGSSQQPTFLQKQLIFLLAVQDYLNNTINLEELSGIGKYMDEYPQDSDEPQFEEFK